MSEVEGSEPEDEDLPAVDGLDLAPATLGEGWSIAALVEEDQRPLIEAQTFEVVAELAQPFRQRIASSLAPHLELEGEALAAAVRRLLI